MKKIALTKAKFAIVDDEDYEFINQRKWRFHDQGYAISSESVGNLNGKRKFKNYYMHRLIMVTPDDMDTDHINGDKLDNRKINLRICTRAENNRNKLPRKNSSSRFKGVFWREDRKKWRAVIFNKKQIHLGMFTSEIDAAIAYNEAAIKYFGEFAKLNKLSNSV